MATTGTYSNEETIRAWADITLNIWQIKLREQGISNTNALYESLKHTLFLSAGNNVDKIEFSFKLYGIFVDMGVGNGILAGNRGNLGFTPIRKRKPWYSKVFYHEVMRLKEILTRVYGDEAGRAIVYSMTPVGK